MKSVQYIAGNDWQTDRLLYEDEYGNRGEVRFPRGRESSFGVARWEDAEVVLRSNLDGCADDVAAAADFAHELAHVAKTLDLAFAEDRQVMLGKAEREKEEREAREAVRKQAIRWRCEDLAQYYMQLVRVQRKDHSSNAKGELHVTMIERQDEPTEIRKSMFLIESNGNRWHFEAYAVEKFEVKDGNRYNEVKLTSMEDLEERARKELVQG